METPVRFGIIACSRVASRRFLPALVSSSFARLERIGSRDRNKARQFAEDFSCDKFGSYEDVLADSSVDAVYISTPPLLHAEWIEKAARAGKHIICEKPISPDYETALKAVDACQRAGIYILENYAFAYHPQHRIAADLVKKKSIGTLLHLEAEYTYPFPPAGDIRLRPELGGGVFHDSAGYPVVAAVLHFGEQPTSVFSHSRFDQKKKIDTACLISMNFSDGKTAHGHVAIGAPYRARYVLLGTRGRIEVQRAFSVDPDTSTEILFETERGQEKIQVAGADQFQLLLENFCTQIKGAGNRADLDTKILRQSAVMEAVSRSQREGRLVLVSEIMKK